MHIKNGRVYPTPPRPSPQQQELSSSAATTSAASLVPYCVSGEDESSSSDSEAPQPSSSDMPSLGETSPFSSHSKPVLANSSILTATSKRQSCTNTGTSASGETVCSSSNRNPSASCTAVSKSVQTKRSDTSNLNTRTDSGFTSLSGIKVESGSEVKSPQSDGICSQNSIGFVPRGNAGIENDAAKCSLLLTENLQSRKTDVRNGSVSHSRNDAVSGESRGAENRGNGVAPSGTRQFVDKEITDGSTTVRVSLPPSHENHNTGWQVTDLLFHSSTVAGETSDSSSNSVANSTTGWAVSDVKQKHSSVSVRCKEPVPKCCCSDSTSANETELLKGEAEAWKSCSDSGASVECKTVSTTPKSGHMKKRKTCDDDNKSQETLSHSTSKDIREDSYSKEYIRKQEKKLKRLKKHKK